MSKKKYIDADALIEKLYPLGMGDGNYGINAKAVRVAIDSVATADVVEVKRGEWEVVHGVLTPGGDPLLRCGNCKSVESEHLCGVEHPSSWNCCPVCGAKMGGDSNAR